MEKKKLIEVALPLDAINAASAREKSIRHGHPSTLHLWWARRPLAAARAVIWASLVDDPSSHPEKFPTEDEQQKERERLFRILEELILWENSNDQRVLELAKNEIKKSMGDDIPELLDPFAGGGAIPLEAERLGLKAHAHDLNPVAVMINKAMIEIPPKFQDLPAINPDFRYREGKTPCERSIGLGKDIQYYGEWLKEEAEKKIGNLYPKVKLDNGEEATVIAWIWARTVKCPNPACNCEAPLVRSFDLSTKKGKEYHVNPIDMEKYFGFEVRKGKSKVEGTVDRKGAVCLHCGESIPFDYIRNEAQKGQMGSSLIAVVAEGKSGRLFLPPDQIQIQSAQVKKPEDIPNSNLPPKALGFRVQAYGLNQWKDLFTNRQLVALSTFSDLIEEAQKKAEADALIAGLSNDGIGLEEGGTGAKAYGQAIGVYLAFLIDKMADYHSNLCSWHSSGEKMRNVFGRQAIPMVWDYAEANPFSKSSGSFTNMLEWIVKAVNSFPVETQGEVSQFEAQKDCGLRNIMISTDPPYYDNIGYADLSDFFYVWLRRSLRQTYPKLFSTMLVPKSEELIATPYRHGGSKEEAKEFFEDGMFETCTEFYKYARDDIPVTIYYAYKQSDSDPNGTASSGWETMLNAIIHSGFSITGTWPIRTEMANRQIASGTNALASSIVLVCRKRPETARVTTRRKFAAELKRELYPALEKLHTSNIAPVDLAQSAIGPGIAVFSKYKAVLESDGKEVTVRTALQLINKEIDAFYNERGEDFDPLTRFCVDLYSQYGFNEMKFGEADILARAKNTSVEKVEDAKDVVAQKGMVHLIKREELTEEVDRSTNLWRFTQQMTREIVDDGVASAAAVYLKGRPGFGEKARDLVYRLFTIADRKGWNDEARAYNTLIQAWTDIVERAEEKKKESRYESATLFD